MLTIVGLFGLIAATLSLSFGDMLISDPEEEGAEADAPDDPLDELERPIAEPNGSEEGDIISGSAEQDQLHGLGGDDQINGYGGDDWIWGEDGADDLHGGAGDDTLDGGAGSDTLRGEEGDDSLFGGDGDDALWGHAGDDSLSGGDGDDSLTGGEGQDWLWGGEGADTLSGGLGRDTLLGGGGQDELFGGSGDDRLIGSDDALRDFLNGGTGNDTLQMGADDWATGDEGHDEFAIASGASGATIEDFDPALDRIVVDYNPADHPDPQLSLEPSEVEGAVWLLLDGHRLAQILTPGDLRLDQIGLNPVAPGDG